MNFSFVVELPVMSCVHDKFCGRKFVWPWKIFNHEKYRLYGITVLMQYMLQCKPEVGIVLTFKNITDSSIRFQCDE